MGETKVPETPSRRPVQPAAGPTPVGPPRTAPPDFGHHPPPARSAGRLVVYLVAGLLGVVILVVYGLLTLPPVS